VTLARKLANLVEVLPGVFVAFQPLDALRLGFFNICHRVSIARKTSGLKAKNPRLP
jgi:hypothetical protein